MEFERKFKDTGEDNLKQFEESIGFHLPDDYKVFILKSNGGKPNPQRISISELNEEIIVDIFFGIDLSSNFDLKSWWEEYREEMPEGCLIIAGEPGANFILLSTNIDFEGVYYWDHTFAMKKSPEEKNTYFIAPTFQDFISLFN